MIPVEAKKWKGSETMLKTFIGAVACAAVLASSANAQLFTFTTKDGEGRKEMGMMSPEGAPIMGAYWTGAAKTVWADGKKSNETYACVSVTQPPRDSIFFMHLVCDSTAADGVFTSTWGCNPLDKEGTAIGCVGGLLGKSGAYVGKRGSASFQGKADGSGQGAGQWYK
ncbi:MAG: hypothetical protein K2Q06_13965 [Parvularculaceae bacterium]|nr:hypothetical protein [Parvularculaceae bacterium]